MRARPRDDLGPLAPEGGFPPGTFRRSGRVTLHHAAKFYRTGLEVRRRGVLPREQTNKRVHAWAFEGDFDPGTLISNTFELEWPPRSGQRRSFPEVDRADFFTFEAARPKIIAAQMELLERLAERLDPAGRPLA